MNHILDYIMVPMQLIIVFFTLYYFIIAFFGMWRRREYKILTPQKHSRWLLLRIMKNKLLCLC